MSEILKDLYKVNTRQVYLLWRNFVLALLVIMLMTLLSSVMPSVYAPIISTVACAILYFMVYNHTYSDSETCVIIPYTAFITTLVYTFVLITLNLLNIWGILSLPEALIFFDGYYLPALLLGPTGIIVSTIIYIRRHKLAICSECKLQNGGPIERGRSGIIFSRESEIQIKNLILLSVVSSILIWWYFIYEFNTVSITSRDTFIYLWSQLLLFVGDAVYFGIRYYNLYLDLKERNELVSPSELQNVTTRTYLRYYVICGDSIYLCTKDKDELRDEHYGSIYDTPFLAYRIINGVPEQEVLSTIQRATGVNDGMLKFFFGRRVSDIGEHRILRYFYFLPGEPGDYPLLKVKGEWLSSEKFKTLYNTRPMCLGTTFLADMSRLATIMVTSKTYNERGERRNKLMQYRPSFNFLELQDSDVDFHDEFWIRISLYNSDHRFFKLTQWLRHGRRNNKKVPYNHTPLT